MAEASSSGERAQLCKLLRWTGLPPFRVRVNHNGEEEVQQKREEHEEVDGRVLATTLATASGWRLSLRERAPPPAGGPGSTS